MIVVIGGSGFVGSALCRRFARDGRGFLILDTRRSETFPERWVHADVRDLQSLVAAIPEDADAIINLAAEHRDDVMPRSRYFDVNVRGAQNVCLAATERCCNTILFTSSVACYGLAAAGTNEDGALAPFNEYGRTKALAEARFKEWHEEAPSSRSLVIVRPTVIFGEGNRGNVYNLLRQVASGRFVMVGRGLNAKSMAYVENVAAFLDHCVSLPQGLHVFNYVDKPDLDMETLIRRVRGILGLDTRRNLRIPLWLGVAIGHGFDAMARVTGRNFPISAVRVRKFCSVTQFSSRAESTGFVAPFGLDAALERTVRYEFLEEHGESPVFYSE